MTKLVLEEGGFYITRDGRKVGPMVEEKTWPWDVKNGEGDLSTMLWEDDGTADETTDADLIEEWKEEPMTKLVLKEGGFYINRKGEKVGPVERDISELGTTFEWTYAGTMWRTDGREYNTFENEYDLIEEWKEEPVTKFNIGDKVKATTPEIVCDFFEGGVGVVVHICEPCDVTGEQVVVIDYEGTYQQTAYTSQDGVVLVEEAKEPQEAPQEDGEWGPWVFDLEGSKTARIVVIEYADGEYVRHKTKKPVAKKQIEVGKSYVTKSNGLVYKCIYIEGDKAWMVSHNGNPAYVWTLDGVSISLNETWDIDFSQDPKDQVQF